MKVTVSVVYAQNFFEKSKGLIGQKKPYPLYFKTRWGIHTFGMKFPIDIIILDPENRVVAVKKNLKPNRIWLWNPQYDSVIELPAGTIQTKQIAINSHIILDST